jgi:hypothetical protein
MFTAHYIRAVINNFTFDGTVVNSECFVVPQDSFHVHNIVLIAKLRHQDRTDFHFYELYLCRQQRGPKFLDILF